MKSLSKLKKKFLVSTNWTWFWERERERWIGNSIYSIYTLYDEYTIIFQTEKAVELLTKFESIGGAELDMNEKYMRVLMNYGKDLESIRKAYQKYKAEPLIPRNLPPVAGRIAWSRQLYRKIEHPMKVFKTKPEILKVCDLSLIKFSEMGGWGLLSYRLSEYVICMYFSK